MNKILLVGELNPYGVDPKYALYPQPAHASGARLQEILGLSLTDYLKHHDRVNLCTRVWSAKAARERAQELQLERPAGTGIVCCGAQVAKAFDLPYVVGIVHHPGYKQIFLVIPHPSGRNRRWNDAALSGSVRTCYDGLRAMVGYELQIPRSE